jgi:8-oxo-dGTP pyrophosphatase MutT (NUDIX family)
VQETAARSQSGNKSATFYVVDSPTWINVIPLTEDRQVVFVKQFRAGRENISLEIPGGMMDPEDRDPAMAARRELHEETGYICRDLRHLGTIEPNPAMQNNLCHTYLATVLKPAGPARPDPHEDLVTQQVALADVPRLIRNGSITHALVVVAFSWLLGLGSDSVDYSGAERNRRSRSATNHTHNQSTHHNPEGEG